MGLTGFNRARRLADVLLQAALDTEAEDEQDSYRYSSMPSTSIDTGSLGVIAFDDQGMATVTPAQVKWLDEKAAAGELPAELKAINDGAKPPKKTGSRKQTKS